MKRCVKCGELLDSTHTDICKECKKNNKEYFLGAAIKKMFVLLVVLVLFISAGTVIGESNSSEITDVTDTYIDVEQEEQACKTIEVEEAEKVQTFQIEIVEEINDIVEEMEQEEVVVNESVTEPVITEEDTEQIVSQPDEFSIGTETDLDMLAMIIYQEAGSDWCQDSTRQMVGEVVLNRVADSRFPNSIYEVLTAEGQYGTLSWTGIVWPHRAYTQPEAHAVQRAYACAESLLSNIVERLLPQDAVWQAGFPQGIETMAIQDGMYFCR